MTTKAVTLTRKNGDTTDVLLPRTSANLTGYSNPDMPGVEHVAGALDDLFATSSENMSALTDRMETLESGQDEQDADISAAGAAAADWTASKPGIVQRVETLEAEMDAVETAAANAQATANEANADSGVTAGSYGHPGNYAPAHGQGFYVPYFTVNAKGKVTGAMNAVITMPAPVHCTHCTHCSHCGYCVHCTYCHYCQTNCSNNGGWC